MQNKKGRYKKLNSKDFAAIQQLMSNGMMKFVIHHGKIDVWRLNYLTRALADGAMLGLEPDDIERAIAQWMKNPSPETLKSAYLDIVIEGTSMDKSAKQSGLDAKGLIDLMASLQYVGVDSSDYLRNPKTFQTIRNLGDKKGVDAIVNQALGDVYSLPEGATKDKTPSQILNKVAEAQRSGEDGKLGNPEFWGVSSKPKIPSSNVDNLLRKSVDYSLITTADLKNIVRDETLVWIDDEKTIPWVIKRHYDDGSVDIVTSDGQGNLKVCTQDAESLNKEGTHAPMRTIMNTCRPVPRYAGNKRKPGVIGID